MSGHSKWHNIQERKGKQDAKRSNLFTKYARGITVAAQKGGADAATNFALRLAIEKAKSIGIPKDTIERAILRGTGGLKDGAAFEELLYEAFGPSGVGMMIEAVTDNVNRTAPEIKMVLSKLGGTLGSPGSVRWQFGHQGVVRVSSEQRARLRQNYAGQAINNTDDLSLALIDAGADDIIESDDGIEIICPVEKLQKILEVAKSFLSEAGVPDEAVAEASLEWVPKETMPLDEAASQKLLTLTDALENLDDVRGVYTNEG